MAVSTLTPGLCVTCSAPFLPLKHVLTCKICLESHHRKTGIRPSMPNHLWATTKLNCICQKCSPDLNTTLPDLSFLDDDPIEQEQLASTTRTTCFPNQEKDPFLLL